MVVLQNYSSIWMAWVVIIAIYIQINTKKKMNAEFRNAIKEGIPYNYAKDLISDRTTVINFIASFVIYGFSIYAFYIFKQHIK